MVKYFRIREVSLEKRENYLRKIFLETTINNFPTAFLKVIIPKGVTAKKHYHEKHAEVFVFLNGLGVVIVESNGKKEKFIVKKGDFMLINPKEKHTVRAVSKDLELLVIKTPYIPKDKTIVCS